MKKTYHICLSSGNEIYCRDEEDYIHCFNSLALAIAETDSHLLAEAIMSTHAHECVRTDNPKHVIKNQRYKYTRYFNTKYHRKGRLGERAPFIIELSGLYHTLAALSYTLRNPVHHGVAPTPFAYPHCSAKAIFQKTIGLAPPHSLMPEHNIRVHMPSRKRCPNGYRMDKSGLILREDVIDTSDVEHLYGTSRAFLYYMNRISGEEWKREQEKDGAALQPITLDIIEGGFPNQSIEQMLRNEHGRNDYRAMSDIDLCHIIDKIILPRMNRESVYTLYREEKVQIARELSAKYKLPSAQIRRCLVML